MLRLENGESGELIAALTKQTLTFIGSTGEGDSSPNYTSTSIVSDGDSLVTAISKLDTSLGTYGDHGLLTGLGDDDHPQYGAVAQNEEISGQWYFDQSLGIGISAPAAYGSGGTPRIVQIQSTDYSILNLSSSDTTNGEVMGSVIGVSSGLSGADKRIGYVSFTKTSASTADPTGKIEFGTANGGSPSTKMELAHNGVLTLYGSEIYVDSTDDARLKLDRGITTEESIVQHMTAGTTRWLVGMQVSSSDYIIYNNSTVDNALTISLIDNTATFATDVSVGDDLGVGGTLTVADDVNFDSGTFYVDASANRTYQGETSYTSSGGTLDSLFPFRRQVVATETSFDSKICTGSTSIGVGDEFWHDSSSPAASDDVYRAYYYGNDSGGNLTDYALFRVEIDDPTNGSEDGAAIFETMDAGTRSPKLELNSSGVMLCDDLTWDADHVYDIGSLAVSSVDLYNQNGISLTSDERLKESIEDTDLGLDFINAIRPVKFKWKEGFKKVTRTKKIVTREGVEKIVKRTSRIKKEQHEKRYHYGLLAQQIEKILNGKDFAGFCYDSEYDKYVLRQSEFISPMIKAIQELCTRLEKLESK